MVPKGKHPPRPSYIFRIPISDTAMIPVHTVKNLHIARIFGTIAYHPMEFGMGNYQYGLNRLPGILILLGICNVQRCHITYRYIENFGLKKALISV